MIILQIRNVEIVCWFENFEFARFKTFKSSKNKIILYAKTTNILNILTFVDVFEKIIILHVHFAIISKF